MNENQQFVSLIFKCINKEIQSLTEQEVKDILEEKVTIKVVLCPKNSKQLTNQREISHNKGKLTINSVQEPLKKTEIYAIKQIDNQEFKLEEIAEKLKKINTRDEGFILLDNSCSTRKKLQDLAVHIDIPNNRKDTKQELRDKIIEATIGYRLRSKAIQGETLTTHTGELDRQAPQESQPDQVEPTQGQ